MSAAQRKWRRGGAERRGVTAVEFAMTAPILFMLLFSALEFGRMNTLRQTANNAAYEAARECIVPGASASDGVTKAEELLTMVRVKNAEVTLSPATITENTEQVTATVRVPVGPNLWLAPIYFTDHTLEYHCTMTREWAMVGQ